MRAVIQRADFAKVEVEGDSVAEIGQGLCLLLGVFADDTDADIKKIAEKACNLRIFDDEKGFMNRSLLETGGSMMIVSQFTLCADCRRGRRPSWHLAARPEFARDMYNRFVDAVKALGVKTQTGVFQADMKVTLCNNGPVTIILDSKE